MTLNLTERLANYKKPKNIILFVVICFLPGLTYLP